MRRLAVSAVLGVIALGLFLYAQPLLTIRALAGALERFDGEAIRERMDAETVRQSLREQYVARLGKQADESERAAAVIASLALFGKGIEMIIAMTRDEDPAEIADWGYDTTSRFRATLRQGAEPPMTLVLRRQHFSWQLIAMEPAEAGWLELGPSLTPPR